MVKKSTLKMFTYKYKQFIKYFLSHCLAIKFHTFMLQGGLLVFIITIYKILINSLFLFCYCLLCLACINLYVKLITFVLRTFKKYILLADH
jgi:hypothetical protein